MAKGKGQKPQQPTKAPHAVKQPRVNRKARHDLAAAKKRARPIKVERGTARALRREALKNKGLLEVREAA